MTHNDLKPAYQVLEGAEASFRNFFWLPWIAKLLEEGIRANSSGRPLWLYSAGFLAIQNNNKLRNPLGSFSRLALKYLPAPLVIAPSLPKIFSRLILNPFYNLRVACRAHGLRRNLSSYFTRHFFLLFSGALFSAIEIGINDLFIQHLQPGPIIREILF